MDTFVIVMLGVAIFVQAILYGTLITNANDKIKTLETKNEALSDKNNMISVQVVTLQYKYHELSNEFDRIERKLDSISNTYIGKTTKL